MAKIQLNGKKVSIKPNLTIFDLIKRYKLENKKIAVEHNGKIIQKNNFKKKFIKEIDKKKIAIEHNGIIIPKLKYKKKYLKNNDQLEIVHFIGGG